MRKGKVYVFNIFSEEMDFFSVNGQQIASIPRWSAGGKDKPPPFTPASIAVDRETQPDIGVFGNGKNQIYLLWPSGFYGFQLTINGLDFPISQDLILTIMRDRWQFIDSAGIVRQEGKLEAAPLALLLKAGLSGTNRGKA